MIRPMNRLTLFLIGIVLFGVAGFALIWFGVGRELNQPTYKTLMDLRDGKQAEVHERAHASLKGRQSPDDLAAYWAWWTGEMGAFVEVLARRGISVTETDEGSFKGITFELGFMKGKMRGTFRYETSAEEPRLAHFRFAKLNENAGREDDRDILQVITRGLFDRYDASDWVGLYAALGFDLQQAWPLAKVEEQMPRIFEQFGKVKQGGLTLTKTEDGPHQDAVVQHYDIEFEKGKSAAKVSFKYDDKSWHLVGFVIK